MMLTPSVPQDGADAYAPNGPEEDEDYDDDVEEDDLRGNGLHGKRRATRGDGLELRRSSRAAAQPNGHRQTSDAWDQWRGERRSTRLGAPPEMQMEGPPPKRARTEESTISDNISIASEGARNTSKDPKSGLLKPSETAVEQVAGKKKSKFWFYAVEPTAGAEALEAPPSSHASSATGDGLMGDESNGDITMDDRDSRPASVEAEDDP